MSDKNITWHEGSVRREDRQRLLGQRGVTIWLTGLSAAGKSTIACILERALLQRGKLAYRLDGDNIRHGLCSNLGFSAADRTENIRRVAEVARLFSDAGVIVIASFISPYRADRDAARAGSASGDFVEVHVKVSVETAAKRDPKGLYKKALAGQIKGFTGIDDPYEEPLQPEVVIESETCSAEAAAEQILNYLEKGGYLGHELH